MEAEKILATDKTAATLKLVRSMILDETQVFNKASLALGEAVLNQICDSAISDTKNRLRLEEAVEKAESKFNASYARLKLLEKAATVAGRRHIEALGLEKEALAKRGWIKTGDSCASEGF